MAILDIDLLCCNPEQILEATVVATLVNGKKVFET